MARLRISPTTAVSFTPSRRAAQAMGRPHQARIGPGEHHRSAYHRRQLQHYGQRLRRQRRISQRQRRDEHPQHHQGKEDEAQGTHPVPQHQQDPGGGTGGLPQGQADPRAQQQDGRTGPGQVTQRDPQQQPAAHQRGR